MRYNTYKMVGQKNNLIKFQKLKENNNIPHFIIVSGPELSGKGSLIKEFCSIIDKDADINKMVASVEDMRNMINNKVSRTTIYIIEDFETMSLAGQSSVLKIFEEPPENCYFIISTKNEDIMLDTIMSRGQLFKMERYTKEELDVFAKDKKDDPYLYELCKTPSEILYWLDRDINKFKEFINLSYDTLLNKTIPYSLDLLKDIGYNPNEDLPYYLYYFRVLNKKIIKDFNWKDEEQYKKFMELVEKTNKYVRSSGTRKDNLMEVYIIKLWHILKGK